MMWQKKKSSCDEPVAPGRDRAFKPSGEEEWKRSKNLEAEKAETVLYAMLPKHIRLRKLKESAWFLPWRFLPCPLLLLICMVLNFVAPFLAVHLPVPRYSFSPDDELQHPGHTYKHHQGQSIYDDGEQMAAHEEQALHGSST